MSYDFEKYLQEIELESLIFLYNDYCFECSKAFHKMENLQNTIIDYCFKSKNFNRLDTKGNNIVYFKDNEEPGLFWEIEMKIFTESDQAFDPPYETINVTRRSKYDIKIQEEKPKWTSFIMTFTKFEINLKFLN